MKRYQFIWLLMIFLFLFFSCEQKECDSLKEQIASLEKQNRQLSLQLVNFHQNPRLTVLKRVSSIKETSDNDLLKTIAAKNPDGSINGVVEIPAGSLEKWEVDKKGKDFFLEIRNGKPRIIKYLGVI